MNPFERHEQILQVALTHGVVKADWIYPTLYPQLSMESAIKDLQGLMKQRLLRRHRGYYVPTERLCLHRGIHRKYGQTKGELTLARRVAVASYCLRYGLERYSAPQFKARFPELSTVGHRGHYYIDGDLIGWAEPDCNVNGDTRILIEKVGRIFASRARNAHWKKKIDAQQFHVTIVTPSIGKKFVLQTRLDERKFLGPVYVEVVEELQRLLIPETKPWRSENSKSRSTAPPWPSANGTAKNGSGEVPPSRS